MAVTTGFSSSRRANARAAAFAAKQKRQKVIIAVGLVLLLLILAYEVPHTLKLMHGSSPSSASSTTTAPTTPAPGATTTAPAHSSAAWRAVSRLPQSDPFANSTPKDAGTYGNVSVPAGLKDPFAATVDASSGSSSASTGTAATTTPAKTIVVGSPGSGRSAQTGWIVILASIPSAQGRATATSFARKAGGHGVGAVSILDSSKAKPLRAGYWVVYTGPFPTLAAVTKNASHARALGYSGAYVRQLVVYGKKS
jgi:hypothetical protein